MVRVRRLETTVRGLELFVGVVKNGSWAWLRMVHGRGLELFVVVVFNNGNIV